MIVICARKYSLRLKSLKKISIWLSNLNHLLDSLWQGDEEIAMGGLRASISNVYQSSKKLIDPAKINVRSLLCEETGEAFSVIQVDCLAFIYKEMQHDDCKVPVTERAAAPSRSSRTAAETLYLHSQLFENSKLAMHDATSLFSMTGAGRYKNISHCQYCKCMRSHGSQFITGSWVQ